MHSRTTRSFNDSNVCAPATKHDERSDVARRDDQHERQRHAQKRLRIPRLPLAAESPLLADSERKAAEGADGQDQADDVAESAPHLQQRERDGTDDRLEPGDDRGHELN